MLSMKRFSELQELLYQDLKTQLPVERRLLLISEMKGLKDKKIHCFNCPGTCCTFSANSMQITPLEAFEILISLQLTSEAIPELKTKLLKNVQDYRLDHEIFLGKKNNSHLRKTYTCPFFAAGTLGCTIKKELKPYGCLGFNPRIEDDNGDQCHSNKDLLLERERKAQMSEEMANALLKEKLNLNWTKLEIPKAVLQLLDKLTY